MAKYIGNQIVLNKRELNILRHWLELMIKGLGCRNDGCSDRCLISYRMQLLSGLVYLHSYVVDQLMSRYGDA